MVIKMIKDISLIVILICTTMIGFTYGIEFRNRVKELRDIENMVNYIKNELRFSHDTITIILRKSVNVSSQNIKTFINNLCDYIDEDKVNSLEEAFYLVKNKGKTSLKEEDYKVLEDMFKTLGGWDVEGQISMIDLALRNIFSQIEKAEDLRIKNEKIYRSLGISIGAIIDILLF